MSYMRKISHILCHPHITSRHSRVTHAICCAIYFVSFCYPCLAPRVVSTSCITSRIVQYQCCATSRYFACLVCHFMSLSRHLPLHRCDFLSRYVRSSCDSPLLSFPEGALFVPFLCRLYACRFSTPFLSCSNHRHTLYEENVLYSLKMKTYRHEIRIKKFQL